MQSPSTILTLVPLHKMFTGRDGMPGPRSLDNPLALHSTVMRLFGPVDGDSPRAATGVLFRVEPAGPGKPGALLIRSAVPPVTHIDGMLSRAEASAPAAGTPVAFRLSVNAVRRSSTRGRDATTGPRPATYSVPRDDDPDNDGPGMTEWVAERLAGAIGGVEILNHDRNVVGRKTSRVVQTDLVDGFGVVEDPQKLTGLLTAGVGRAKNYGCGLLTIKAIG
ncbi:type I-E CRISPR-associated protein Cas6/Cse3/CasE [Arthrobacter sp. ISL-28]|uniref:type I-E CRISPR-associated protein Cas6/Cse3/CasE n=1 Tax=Arthrobacter sp. ISL-28 TaxID=2819108 RepID=UPI001BE8D497|nr:type I-E CRISPR-associated protein Cas6/Cse3/CasE [Arthrobacter sp. ISL-28]MBT2520859.1 type I-E CRISPR-associated protein Cas6/Cse3/CasE [Arthrobacter sp. ISL-28]